jgi:two-component system, OmpR family, sensor histidine kinase VicK
MNSFDNNSSERTEVFIGDEIASGIVMQAISDLKYKCESCTDSTAPSVSIEVFRKPMDDAKSRGISFRYLTEITSSNLAYCKQLSKLAELRHLDQVKGNFSIFDEKVYLASAVLKEAQPVAQLIYSNVATIVEQQRYLFETLWNKAVPAEQKIREIEEGVPTERTEVLHTPENTTKAIIEFLYETHNLLCICADSSWPSVAMGIDAFKKALGEVSNRRVKSKFVTEITKDNLSYCKELMKVGELLHLDGIKGNFAVSEKEYIASATLQEATLLQQVIYSNIKEIVEQQRYVFDSFWTRAIPAEMRIKQIEEGITFGETQVIHVPLRIQELFIHLVKSAREEILLILPTINAFFREERLGIIRLLKEAALERGANVRVLTPADQIIEEKIQNMLANNLAKKLEIRPMHLTAEETAVTTVTILVIDKKESLAIEKIDDSKANFIDATGSATYSNSKPTVLSYLSIFESLWQQTELYEHVKQTNKLLENANEQLKITEKAKEEFISMISHELKTPLVPLKGYAQMLLRPKIMGAEVNERQKNAIIAMNRNIEKLQALVDDVMDVYKLDMGKLKFSMIDMDVSKLVNETISELKPLASDKKIDLISDIRVDGTVFCDPNRIYQVVSNLIKNSIDFVPEDGGGKVTVRVETDDDYRGCKMTLFTVEDNGIGIKQEKADKLFQKFYQIDTGPTRKHEGTGLGLVICRGIIDAHGGKIWLDKTYRNGTAIRFTLPQSGERSGIVQL